MALGFSIVALPLDYTYISQEVCAYVFVCVYMCAHVLCLFACPSLPIGCTFTGGWVGTSMGISKQTLTQPFL